MVSHAFAATLTWPETQQRVRELFKRGLQQEGDLENRFGEHLATLFDGQRADSDAE